MTGHKRFSWMMAGILLLAGAAAAAEGETAAPSSVVGQWLVFGPVAAPLPAFDEKDRDAMLQELLQADSLHRGFGLPAAGEAVSWFGTEKSWRVVEADSEGVVALSVPEAIGDDTGAVAWLATSLATSRFMVLELEVDSEHPIRATVDGDEIEVKDGAEIELEPGSHTLVVKTVFNPECEDPWSVATAITGDFVESVRVATEVERDLGILDVLDAASVTAFDISPDGSKVLLERNRVRPGTDIRESWAEMRATGDGKLLDSWRGAPAMRQLAFAPTGDRFSYVTRHAKDTTSSLWVVDLSSRETREIAAGVKNWRSYSWSPTGENIVYSSSEEPEEDERGVKHVRGLLDRMADHRTISSLYLLSVADGTTRRLTSGPVSSSAGGFSPDGKRLLVTREVEDLRRRPYTRTELWEIDLGNGQSNKLRDGRWINQVDFAPDGDRLLVLAGASEFGDAGIADGVRRPVNDFDGQLFIWDPDTDDVVPLTREFDPSVVSARWSRHDGAIYLLTVDGEYRNIYRLTPQEIRFEFLETGIESVGSFDLADGATTLVASGSSVWQPQRVVVLADDQAQPNLLLEPAVERYRVIRRGDVEQWNFTAADGRTVVGRVYLPIGFDRTKRYPAIVNYYGGTSPMSRTFGGRYPAEWWAANGYVVYVLTPTGAYGWGQEESAVHVNDWGEITGRQIIEATEAFLKAHRYVDPDRLGCIGASYGGFMTMGLVTKTDLFAAAVAHAGISALSSYWGEGYWGYSYGAVANADSFPWNRKDLFVERSPLFSANKVTTPVLLTHGTDDPNVPPGESAQFYAALKLLGVPADYLQIDGLGHLIMEHDKRAVWSKSIIAWFDRWLKGEPEWWDTLYPAPQAGGKK